MSASDKPKGKCEFCGRMMTSGGLVRHLKSCDDRDQAVMYANENNKKARE